MCGAGVDQRPVARSRGGHLAHSQHSSASAVWLLSKRTSKHSSPGCLLHWYRCAHLFVCLPSCFLVKMIQKQHQCASGHTKHCFVASCTAGDLMTALLLANLYKDSSNMQHAVEQAIAGLQAVLQASAEVSGPAAHSRERSAEVHIFLVNVLCFAFFIFCSLGSENVYGQISQCSPSDTCLCVSTATRDHSITSSAGVQSKGVALDTEPAPYNVAAS